MIAQGFHVPSANYFGLMNPTPTYMAVMAEALVAALNPQLASLARSQLSDAQEFAREHGIPLRIIEDIIEKLHLDKASVMEGGRYHNMRDLADYPAAREALVSYVDSLEPRLRR